MLMAASLSRRLGWLDATEHARIRDLLMRAGLPTEAPRMGVSRALELIQMDKKVLSGTVRLVLLERLGRAVMTGAYGQDMLDATLAEYCA
jgi:3-dehydroquinate synthetase